MEPDTHDAEVVVTLVGMRLAKEGVEFIFTGVAEECEACRLRNSCTNLDEGRRYRVVKVRSGTEHDCPIHDGGVIAVEVIEPPIRAAIESKKCFDRSKIIYDPGVCRFIDCEFRDFCFAPGLVKGDKYIIQNVLGDLEDGCKDGRSLKLVELKRAV
ncbi:MAG TPA: UPF0179 family protein [Candidatus Syntrophoarchaeum butanivorans]|nr:MAG: UPF0179 family protein [Candidatus Syntrophoarchaeum sp. WYZ-LMO15]HDM35909.1 UPF0179 family protein [Candidatus Syntrophoarchaeum butanivorans]HEC56637.1 UPF0179 family protein [Candidatus Syntrophoarchaeum butanivorans]